MDFEIKPMNVYTMSFDANDLVEGILTINHGLKTRAPIVSIYNKTNTWVNNPDFIHVNDINSISIDFVLCGPVIGTWWISVAG